MMSTVVGIDLSTRAIDLVRLDETLNRASHERISLEAVGKRATAWERTLALPALMPQASWWDDVYLVALEAPYGPGTGTIAILNRVLGAVAASLPAALQRPERAWIVCPDEWKGRLGLRAKPSRDDIARLGLVLHGEHADTQDARDALCVAYWARELNAQGLASASAA
jgi:hypothetical protein